MAADTWEIGKVTWLDPANATGIIARDDRDEDVYFEVGVVENKIIPKTGQMVQFQTETGSLGPVATKVVVVADAARQASPRARSLR